jgi:outer membrane receptor protein involved in Fe transport
MMTNRNAISIKYPALPVCGLLQALLVLPLWAAEADEKPLVLETVIVTAQRMEQSANDVGMDIQTITGERLDRLRITDVEDITAVVPSFTVAQSYQGVPTYTLRGIGFNTINVSAKSTVGTYVDEVAYPYPSLNAGPIFDLQRVEVLKGPQGTLFGRNTTAGLINLVTNRPTDEFEAMVRAEVGNFETTNFEGMVSGPLAGDVSGRLALRTERSNEGWQKSNTRDDELGEVDRQGARLALTWEPGDRALVEFSYNWWENQSDMLAAQATRLTPSTTDSAFNTAGLTDYLENNRPDNNDEADWAPRSTRSQDIGTGLGISGDIAEDSRLHAVKLHIAYELADDMRLVSLSGYQDLKRRGVTDFAGAPYELLLQDLDGEIESYSQELRLEGEYDDMTWLLGAYYAKDDLLDSNRTLLGENANVGLVRFGTQSLLNTPFNTGGYTPEEASQAFRTFRDVADMDVESWSVFANADWQLRDNLSLTTGVRYTEDEQDYAGCSRDFNGNMLPNVNVANRALFLQNYGVLANEISQGDCNTFDIDEGQFGIVESKLEEDNVAWRLALNWWTTQDILLYSSISQGAKSGETPVNAANIATQNRPVKQEELLAYEVGVKATLLDGRVQANAAAFYYDYTDKQLAVLFADPIYTVLGRLDNIPDSEAYGLDTEISWLITPELTAIAAATFLDTEIGSYEGVDFEGEVVNYEGSEFLYSPDITANLTLLYARPITDTLGINAAVNGRYQSESHADLAGSDDFAIDSYSVVNASIGIASLDGQWDVSVWGNNLTDEYYWLTVTQNANTNIRFPGKARTYGATLTWRF